MLSASVESQRDGRNSGVNLDQARVCINAGNQDTAIRSCIYAVKTPMTLCWRGFMVGTSFAS
jgi:hypothetical protein